MNENELMSKEQVDEILCKLQGIETSIGCVAIAICGVAGVLFLVFT